ncbi:MAG: hypothetical protein Q4Q04_01525 [Methanocorpusculum sp.]|nr:hypothetical protein [Methanocorpusculum sp.]
MTKKPVIIIPLLAVTLAGVLLSFAVGSQPSSLSALCIFLAAVCVGLLFLPAAYYLEKKYNGFDASCTKPPAKSAFRYIALAVLTAAVILLAAGYASGFLTMGSNIGHTAYLLGFLAGLFYGGLTLSFHEVCAERGMRKK